jgi:ribonuclease BN (tRNA processing enzyme)
VPTATRGNAAHLLRRQGRSYLFDCGEPVSQALYRAGVDPVTVTAVFVSHLHADHIGGFFQLVQTLQIRGRSQPLSVHLPTEGLTPIAALLEAIYLSPDLLPFPLRLIGNQPGRIFDDQTITVTAQQNKHLETVRTRAGDIAARHPGWALESRSLIVQAGDDCIVYSGDLRAPDELASVLPVATCLVCELVHFQPAALYAALAHAVKLRDLIIAHAHPNLDTRVQEVLDEAQRRLPDGARVHWATDGMTIALGSPLPTQPPLIMV